MAIHFDLMLDETGNPASFESRHWMGYRLADDRVYVDLTGIALLHMKGAEGWARKTLRINVFGGKVTPLLNLKSAEDGYHWEAHPVMWSVSAAPVSMFNRHSAMNAGWAVDSCNTGWDLGDRPSTGNLLGSFPLYLNLAVSDTDGILYRVSYDFRAVGNLRQVRTPVIE